MAATFRERLNARLGDVSGAFADLGTFLPLVVGILAVRGFEATGILVGFGLFAFMTAGFYRLPIPVQPMKAVAALIIVGSLTPGQAAATGLIIGAVLVVLAAFGAIAKIARVVPVSVILGVQMGVGAHLAIMGGGHVIKAPVYGVAALVALVALRVTRFRNFSALAVVAAAVAAALWGANPSNSVISVAPMVHLPSITLPTMADFRTAVWVAVLPQMTLTLSNAVLVTAALAESYFPDTHARASAPRLAFGSGLFNLLLAPFGAMPMCHGAGGLVAQYGFGARSWLTPVIFGGSCLALGIAFGGGAREILALISIGTVGALLAVAGTEMAASHRFFEIKPSCRFVVVATAVVCVISNVATGLVVGVALELLRPAVVRHFFGRAEAS